MMFSEDYLEFDEDEARSEAESSKPMICKRCGNLFQDCDCGCQQDCDCQPELTLNIPRSLSIADMEYWVSRAKALCPGREITPVFV